jgi:hypothetical protein
MISLSLFTWHNSIIKKISVSIYVTVIIYKYVSIIEESTLLGENVWGRELVGSSNSSSDLTRVAIELHPQLK